MTVKVTIKNSEPFVLASPDIARGSTQKTIVVGQRQKTGDPWPGQDDVELLNGAQTELLVHHDLYLIVFEKKDV